MSNELIMNVWFSRMLFDFEDSIWLNVSINTTIHTLCALYSNFTLNLIGCPITLISHINIAKLKTTNAFINLSPVFVSALYLCYFLSQRGQTIGMHKAEKTFKEIAETTKIGLKTVQHIIKNWKEQQ